MQTIPIYKAGIHLGEEKIIQGNGRSGMVTFSWCHLDCRFCYTPETSRRNLGSSVMQSNFYRILLDLKASGAENFNLISPTHVWKAIREPLVTFNRSFPLILKTSGYETELFLKDASFADIFVPDFKVVTQRSARALGLPANYGSVAGNMIQKLIASHGVYQFTSQGQLARGILVRHLLMPGYLDESRQVLETLYNLGYKGFINFMTHFIDARNHRIEEAAREDVNVLISHAERSGMRTLLNGNRISEVKHVA